MGGRVVEGLKGCLVASLSSVLAPYMSYSESQNLNRTSSPRAPAAGSRNIDFATSALPRPQESEASRRGRRAGLGTLIPVEGQLG